MPLRLTSDNMMVRINIFPNVLLVTGLAWCCGENYLNRNGDKTSNVSVRCQSLFIMPLSSGREAGEAGAGHERPLRP